MTHQISIRPDSVQANSADGGDRPIIVVDHGKPDSVECRGLEIIGTDGKVAANIVYDKGRDHHRVWIETELTLRLRM